MKILDTEIQFDFYDADQMEKFETYAEQAQKELEKLDINGLKQSDFIRKTCTIIYKCFDGIFGEGISKEIFKKQNNFKLCMKAFKDLIESRIVQDSEIEEEMKVFKKYTPNRETRRTKK